VFKTVTRECSDAHDMRYNNLFGKHLPLSPKKVKEFQKSVNIWHSYRKIESVQLFDPS